MDVEIELAVRDAVQGAARQSVSFPPDRLDELGWGELLEADSESAVRAFFEEQGRLILSSDVLDSVMIAALGDERFVWPQTQFLFPVPGQTACSSESGTFRGLAFGELAESFVVPVERDGVVRLLTITRAELDIEPVQGIDPTAGLVSATGNATNLEDPGFDADTWATALAAGRRALAHELVGLSSRMIELVVEHVSVRHQFGKPLGINQAVQHKLADAKVLLEAARALTGESWETTTTFAATVAKAQASRAFDLIAASGQQLFGAIGYTWEHEWRRYIRRGFLLSVLLGATDELEREIGEALVADGVPRIGGLYRSGEGGTRVP